MSDYIGRLRRRLGNMKIVIPGVRALIRDEGGRLLLLKRGDFLSWALPAGVVDVGESALQALKREVEEETGLHVRRAEPFGLYSDPRYSVTYPNGDEVQTFTVAFHVPEWSGRLAVDGVEALEARFFALDALPEPLYPVHIDTIMDLRDDRRGFVVK